MTLQMTELCTLNHSPFSQLIYSLSGKAFFLQSKCFLLGGVYEVRYECVPLLLLLKTGEDHLRAGNVLLGVRQVLVESARFPSDA